MKPIALAAAILSTVFLSATATAAKPEGDMKVKGADAKKEMHQQQEEMMSDEAGEAAEDGHHGGMGNKEMGMDQKGMHREDDMDEHMSESMSGEKEGDDMEDKDKSGKKAKKDDKKVPPGLAKKDEHPSTGKGSEQGQEARNAQEKPWWNFWD